MSKKILIADDDQGIVDAVQMMLEFSGYDVAFTYNGKDVMELKQPDLPDLILLDIWMSGVDGRDVCRKLKEHEQTRHIPVLMISASKNVAGSVMEVGADGFLPKPFDMDQLINKIEELLATDSTQAP